jgi:tetratricopeptide (TPR) repeat protein
MRNQVYSFIDNLITYLVIGLVAVTPLVATNLTTDFFDIPKLILLVVFAIILVGLWVTSWIIRGKIEYVKTPLDLPLIFLAVSLLLSTFFSTSKYASIYGALPDVHRSVVSWITYIVLYFVAVSHLQKPGQVRVLLQALIVSASIISLVSILSYFGIYLPFEMARGLNFTPAGSTFSANAFLLMLLPLVVFSSVKLNMIFPRTVAAIVATSFSIAIILTGSVAAYAILVFIFGICIYISRNHLSGKNLALILSPLTVAIILLMLVNLPFPGNIFHEVRNNFPQEIQLPFNISWKIAATAFRDAPFVGTGPGTFIYNFTSYKPAEFNLLSFWNFSFNTAYDEFLQILGTWGLLGFFALLIICLVVVAYARKYVLYKNFEGLTEGSRYFLPGLSIGSLVAVVLLFVHTTTLVSVLVTFSLLAAFMMSQKGSQERVTEISLGIKVSTAGNSQIDLLPVAVFVLYFIAAVFVSGKVYNAVAADYYHRLALSQAGKDGTKTYEYLQKAESLNPYIDLYRVDMAQTNFALANALASKKGPSEDNPQGTLTDDDKKTIQTLVTQAINEGRASVVLAPRSSRDWEVLAVIYRNITGVAKNSLTFALDAYGRAIQLDPLNPALRVNAGSIYYGTKNYDLAIRFFTDAINLKPDYINGYYNLALAMRDKGDLQNAKLIAEQAVSLLQKDFSTQEFKTSPDSLKQSKVKDYNTITDLLSGIKSQIDAGSQETLNEETPSSSNQALQNPNLPNISVPNLDNPPQTTTPPAVEQNPNAQLPDLTPTTIVTPAP